MEDRKWMITQISFIIYVSSSYFNIYPIKFPSLSSSIIFIYLSSWLPINALLYPFFSFIFTWLSTSQLFYILYPHPSANYVHLNTSWNMKWTLTEENNIYIYFFLLSLVNMIHTYHLFSYSWRRGKRRDEKEREKKNAYNEQEEINNNKE